MSTKPGMVTVQKGVTWKTILIIGLLIVSLSLLAALPLSFFFNGNMGNWFGNLPLDLIPPPTNPPQPPDNWQIPDIPNLPQNWQDWDLPPEWEDLLQNYNGTLPGEIPWWLAAGALAYLLAGGSLPGGGGVGSGGGTGGGTGTGVGGLPGMGGAMGNGVGPFGTPNIAVWVSADQPWRYWRIRAYDYFEGKIWVIADNATSPYTENNSPGTDYTVVMQVYFSQQGYGTLPLPHLWNQPMIRSTLQVYDAMGQPPVNLTWNLIEDEYDGVHWNASVGIPGQYYITYNVTYDGSVNLAAIESSVYSGSPLNFVADPGDGHDYLQLPDLSHSNYTAVRQDMQNIATNPALSSMNTYEVAQAVMEHFKTRWWWTPFRAQIPGRDFDPAFLIKNGYGASQDFASNYVTYLRSLNISSRLVWGGLGYQVDPLWSSFLGFNVINLTHSHFWAEVWIPRSTTPGDGEWVQFDPTPFPPYMWMINRTSPTQNIEPFNVRRNDTRVETSHYTMLFSASVPADIPQNRVTDTFNLIGNLQRDGTTITTTWLNQAVTYKYSDFTDNVLVGTSSGAYNNYTFNVNSLVGPHRFNASFYAVQNETIVTCNGTTKVAIEALSPHQLQRGPLSYFLVVSNITDASNNKAIPDAELKGWVVDAARELPDNRGQQLTDRTGHVLSNFSFPSTLSVGLYYFTMNFTGSFLVNYPDPYPDFHYTLPESSAESRNETLIITAGLAISLTVSGGSGNYLPRGQTIVFSGFLSYDNGTGIGGQLITVWWRNSTRTYNISADYTAANGFYQCSYSIPATYNDLSAGNNAYIYANFSAIWGNCTTNRNALYYVRCSNLTAITLSTNIYTLPYVIRGVTSVHVWGTLRDTLGIASTAGQYVNITVFETGQQVALLLTTANGRFDSYVQIPLAQNRGYYNLSATFPGIWVFNYGINIISIPSSASISSRNNTHRGLIVVSTALAKTADPADIGRVVTPTPMIAGDDVYVTGYLLYDNGTPLVSKTVSSWWIKQDGTEYLMGTDNSDISGYYSITYNIVMYEPTNVIVKVNYSAGSLMSTFILNASTSVDPPVMWAVNISINTVTPVAVIRGQSSLTISGRVIEKHGYMTPNERIYLTCNGQRLKDSNGNDVSVVTNGLGFFTTTFIVYQNYPLNANYVVNGTLTNSSFIFNQARTGSLEVNCTTNILNFAVDRTGLIGENITVSGRLVDNLNQDLTGTVRLFANGSQIYSNTATGSFNWIISIPNNPAIAGWNNLTLRHDGSPITFPSSAVRWQYVPQGAVIGITNIAGKTDFINLSLYTGSRITISGTLTDDASPNPIFNRLVQIYYNGTLLGSGLTDANGDYHVTVQIPTMIGNTTIFARFSANGDYDSVAIAVQTIAPTGLGAIFMQFLPWIIGIVAGLVAAVIGHKLYSRRKKKETIMWSKYEGLNLEFLKAKMEALQQGNRFREAIIYAYYLYLQMIKGCYNISKRKSQTATEFAIDLVKKIKLPATMVYSFTTLFEEARFGQREIDSQKYTEAFQLLLNLYEQIIGGSTPLAPASETA